MPRSSKGGRRELLAIHLCACFNHWPKDPDEEYRRWRELHHDRRELFRFMAIRASIFLGVRYDGTPRQPGDPANVKDGLGVPEITGRGARGLAERCKCGHSGWRHGDDGIGSCAECLCAEYVDAIYVEDSEGDGPFLPPPALAAISPITWLCPYCKAGPFTRDGIQGHYRACASRPKPPPPPLMAPRPCEKRGCAEPSATWIPRADDHGNAYLCVFHASELGILIPPPIPPPPPPTPTCCGDCGREIHSRPHRCA